MRVLIIFCVILITALCQISCLTSRYPPYYNGTCIHPANCTGAILNNLCTGEQKFCVNDTYNYVPSAAFSLNETLSNLPFDNKRVRTIYKFLELASGLSTSCGKKAAFFAELLFQSMFFNISEENATETELLKYENRTDLGNDKPGDGAKYRSRGFIMLRGKAMYQNATKALGIDLVNNPEMAAFPSVAGRVAAWYWNTKNINSLFSGSFYDYSKIVKTIDGSLIKLANRTNIFEKILANFQCGKLFKGYSKNCTTTTSNYGYCKPMCVKGLEGKSYCGCNGEALPGICGNDLENVRCCLEKCQGALDLTFVLDSSGSIAATDFAKEIQFVYDIVNGLTIGENATRVAIVNFASTIKIETYLNSYFNKTNLLKAIKAIAQYQTNTFTGEALMACLDIYNVTKGMRSKEYGIPKVVMVLTDGASNGNIKPKDAADKLRARDVTIFSIGVGNSVNIMELNEIASQNNVYSLESFSTILGVIEDLKQFACTQPADIPSITNDIDVDKDSFRYFQYPLNLIPNFSFTIVLQVREGKVEMYTSFSIKNPNGLDQTVDVSIGVSTQRKKRFVTGIGGTVTLNKEPNAQYLYIGVRGFDVKNKFNLQITDEQPIVPISTAFRQLFPKSLILITLLALILF